jgi:hypothetical protein
MVDTLQLVAVAAYLLWCLFASLSDVLRSPEDDGGSKFLKAAKLRLSARARAHHGGCGSREGVR